MSKSNSPLINLVFFPYFPDGDIKISLSPEDTYPLRLHSEILSKYLGYFSIALAAYLQAKNMAWSQPQQSEKRYEIIELIEWSLDDEEIESCILFEKVNTLSLTEPSPKY